MSHPLPNPLAAVVVDVLSDRYSHSVLNRMFMEAGAPGDVPEAPNKSEKCRLWLKRCGEGAGVNAQVVLGALLQDVMEAEIPPPAAYALDYEKEQAAERGAELRAVQARLSGALERFGLTYALGGKIVGGGSGAAARSLSDLLAARDLPAVEKLFQDAVDLAGTKPEDAVGKACSMLESVLKFLIEASGAPLPEKQDLEPLWKVVRKLLKLDPSDLEKDGNEDLLRILSGLASIGMGLGSLRTHESSVHGKGRRGYKLAPRHARLAVHAASTLAIYLIEAWEERNRAPLS